MFNGCHKLLEYLNISEDRIFKYFLFYEGENINNFNQFLNYLNSCKISLYINCLDKNAETLYV